MPFTLGFFALRLQNNRQVGTAMRAHVYSSMNLTIDLQAVSICIETRARKEKLLAKHAGHYAKFCHENNDAGVAFACIALVSGPFALTQCEGCLKLPCAYSLIELENEGVNEVVRGLSPERDVGEKGF